jgi:hypothetical protein
MPRRQQRAGARLACEKGRHEVGQLDPGLRRSEHVRCGPSAMRAGRIDTDSHSLASAIPVDLSVVSCQLSVVSCQLSVVSGQWLSVAVSVVVSGQCQLSVQAVGNPGSGRGRSRSAGRRSGGTMDIQRGDVLKARNLASGMQYWMSGYANWYAKRNRRTGFGFPADSGRPADWDSGLNYSWKGSWKKELVVDWRGCRVLFPCQSTQSVGLPESAGEDASFRPTRVRCTSAGPPLSRAACH